jgi:hypothetical protein
MPLVKAATKFAFMCGGINYYQFEDFDNTPALRGLKTAVFYEEMRMKVSMEYLKEHVKAVDHQLLKPNINIYNIKKLNDQLFQRLDIALDMELVYKIASIVFFTADENVNDYDFAYNAKKVEHWKKYGGTDFFLQKPLVELLPVLKDTKTNLRHYIQMQEQLNQIHLETLLELLPPERMQKLKGKSYLSLAMTHPK